MSANHVKIYLNPVALVNHLDRLYRAGLDRKARRWGFLSIEQCWAVCDLNPDVDRIVTALFSGSTPNRTQKVKVSRKAFIRRMKKHWGDKHLKSTLDSLYRTHRVINTKRKGNLPVDK